LAVWSGAAGSAWAKGRFALVIGNSQYSSTSTLANPVRDANAFSELLKTAGFEVTTALDVGQRDLRRAVSDFADKLADKGEDSVALVYFAGHGVQIDGANYLLPVDVKVQRASDFALQAVRLSDVMDVINNIPSKTRIVILDACRNNPFEDVIDKSQRGLARVDTSFGKSAAAAPAAATTLPGLLTGSTSGASVPKGLAVVTAPPGSLIVYSTSPGATASDGKGVNSPFTAALVEAAKTPGANIETVLRTIRLSVHKSSNGKQTPWEVTALTEPFSFFPGAQGAQPALEPRKSDGDWHHELRSLTPEQAYDVVVLQNNVTVYQIYVSLYGDTPFGIIIRGITDRRIEMYSWFDALTLNTPEAFEAFLRRYPNSDLARTAERLAERAKQRLRAAQASPSILALASIPEVETVVKEVIRKVRVPGPERIVRVPGPERIVHVPGPVRVKTVIKTVVKKVPGPVRVKTVVREVPGPVRIKTVVKTIVKKVPGPVRIKTVIRKVPGPVRVKVKTIIRRVPGPVRTVVRRIRVPCRCRRVVN
ncbi:MAG: caspase family protein, partial [Rhizobiales bacterium]|nr:caspase family protein [Hyphomicrobiales bacterium]